MNDNSYNQNLRPLWNELLKIYSVFRRICEKNNLRYFICYGTAIGAVRHHGFIPWDDDFDVVMPHSDYMKFLSCAKAELPDKMKLVTGVNTGYPSFGFAKICNVSRSDLERMEKELGSALPQGIYIDIFPLCGIPKMTLSLKLKLTYCYLRQYGLQKRRFGRFSGRLAHIVGKFLLMFPGPRNYKELADFKRKISGMLPFDEAEHVGDFNWENYKFAPTTQQHDGNNYLKASWFRDMRMVSFENTEVPIPIGCHEMLTAVYGDYMKLPPVEKRIVTHSSEKPAPWRFGPLLDVDP